MSVIIPTNEFQTPITDELLAQYPDEVREQFLDFVDTVPMIKWMIGLNRTRAKDLPRDEEGKIIVDITHPHILEDMDYFRPAAKFFQENGCYTFLKPNSNPNSEYGKWLAEEARRSRYGYVRESDGEWVPGLMYWYMNYSPIMLNRYDEETKAYIRTEELPDMWEGIYYRTHYLDTARKSGNHAMELAKRGAHPYYQKVYTPDGIKQWGDIQIGDKLYGTHGDIVTVTDIPYDKEAPVYSITLRDGRTVYASDDHVWNIIYHGEVRQFTTSYLAEHYKVHRANPVRVPSGFECTCAIPSNDGVEFSSSNVSIDPYALGIMLGDGCFRAPQYKNQVSIAGTAEDIEHYSKNIPYPVTKYTSSKYTYAIRADISYLHECGLWMKKSEEKFIPSAYKYNSRDVRFKVLQGLFDTDGYVHGNLPEIATSSPMLRDDIMEVARSLGYNCHYCTEKAGYKKDGKYIECNPSYTVSVLAGPEIFTLKRKHDRIAPTKFNGRKHKTIITDIKYVGVSKCKCVTVDAADESYLIGDFVQTHNCSKSYLIASAMSRNLILGERKPKPKEHQRLTSILAAYTKEYLADKDGTLTKFTPMIDFVAANTEFPRLMLKRSSSEMIWRMGYKNANGNEMGSLNSVMGLSVKDDEGKIRGKRGFIFYEEIGNFPNLKETWNNTRDSVKEGNNVFALMYGVGTAGDEVSDFAGVKNMLYNPSAYEILALDNVYDKAGKGAKKFCYFFPSYLSRAGCMDKNGNSDVVKALLEILMARYNAKQSGDPATVLSVTAQQPITPEEAILKVSSNFFPVVMLTERLRQIETNPHFYDNVYVGTLIETGKGVEFRPTDDIPLREYPIRDSDANLHGALEIYKMPPEGDIPANRFVLGIDPIENDEKADSESLFSCVMFDLFTDEVVAEYTGRMPLNEDNCYMAYLLCIFYNAKAMPEANKKNVYAYFAKKHALYMLADCPEYLKERDMVKYSTDGSSSKGVQALPAIIHFAKDLIKDWLLKETTVMSEGENGELVETQMPGVYKLCGKAMIKEMISFGPGVNTDRVSALMQVMLYRHQFQILYGEKGEWSGESGGSEAADDPFFDKGWNRVSGVVKFQ